MFDKLIVVRVRRINADAMLSELSRKTRFAWADGQTIIPRDIFKGHPTDRCFLYLYIYPNREIVEVKSRPHRYIDAINPSAFSKTLFRGRIPRQASLQCEQCGRPPGVADEFRLTRFRGELICGDCLLVDNVNMDKTDEIQRRNDTGSVLKPSPNWEF